MAEQFFAKSTEELTDPDALSSKSGLEFMQAVLDGTHPMPPICKPMNFQLEKVAPGHAVFLGAPEFAHCNPMGGVHGGWYGTLLDSAMGCAVMTCVPKGMVYTTLEYKVNIVRPIRVGTDIVAEAKVSHAGRSTGVAEGTIRGASDGQLYATGSTTCIIMTLDKPDQRS
ncbi:MAG: PaaI family thioesterase [Pseudomonadota bacterium]